MQTFLSQIAIYLNISQFTIEMSIYRVFYYLEVPGVFIPLTRDYPYYHWCEYNLKPTINVMSLCQRWCLAFTTETPGDNAINLWENPSTLGALEFHIAVGKLLIVKWVFLDKCRNSMSKSSFLLYIKETS